MKRSSRHGRHRLLNRSFVRQRSSLFIEGFFYVIVGLCRKGSAFEEMDEVISSERTGHIRLANTSDLLRILHIYEKARAFMSANGNPDQWTGGYPDSHLIAEDIVNKNCYVLIEKDTVVAVFSFVSVKNRHIRKSAAAPGIMTGRTARFTALRRTGLSGGQHRYVFSFALLCIRIFASIRTGIMFLCSGQLRNSAFVAAAVLKSAAANAWRTIIRHNRPGLVIAVGIYPAEIRYG